MLEVAIWKLGVHALKIGTHVHSLVTRPLPQEERPGTHCLCMVETFHYIFRKKLGPLTLSVSGNDTNQEYRALFKMDSIGNLTCRILLEYYFSDMAVSLFQNLQSNRKVTNQFAIVSHRNSCLSSYMACSGFVLKTIGLYNRSSA